MPRPAAERPLPASPARAVGETVAFNGNLDSHYTFDNFVEGRSNQLGRAAASHAAQNPGDRAHNPLLLYGGTGDRKSVVQGKSASVRVVLGGLGVIKKKKHDKKTQ